MKVLKKISLKQLSSFDLEKRKMNSLFGGKTPGCCTCTCQYNTDPYPYHGTENGSSFVSNLSANDLYGLYSSGYATGSAN